MTASGDHDGSGDRDSATAAARGGRTARNNRLLGFAVLAAAAGMVGLAYGAVPFYYRFCRGIFEGVPERVTANTAVEGHRTLRVGFDTNVAPGLDVRFQPEAESIWLRTGKTATVFFRVRNRSDQPVAIRATYNVAPAVSAGYFDKIQCFCFKIEHLGPHESAEWPVVFFLDPALETDASMSRVDSVTLSYTLFATPSERREFRRSADRAGRAG